MKTRISVILVLAAAAVLATAATPKAPAQAAVVLEYKMPSGRALTYQAKSEEAQIIEVMGQSMDTSTATVSDLTFKAKGKKDKDILLGVTVDDMSMSVVGSQGDMSPDMSSVKGKSFDMVLSALGNEVDVSGAEAISFAMEGEARSLVSSFQNFFPDLPGKPVKIGDTWPATASIEEKTTSIVIRLDFQYVHTLDGIEVIDGLECARVVSQVTGAISGSGNQGGQDMTFAGTSKGKDIWFFAVKEGTLVKAASESASEIFIDVPAAGMSIPMTLTSKSEVKLTGKS